MNKEKCKKQIIEKVKQMQDQAALRRLYLIILVILGETE